MESSYSWLQPPSSVSLQKFGCFGPDFIAFHRVSIHFNGYSSIRIGAGFPRELGSSSRPSPSPLFDSFGIVLPCNTLAVFSSQFSSLLPCNCSLEEFWVLNTDEEHSSPCLLAPALSSAFFHREEYVIVHFCARASSLLQTRWLGMHLMSLLLIKVSAAFLKTHFRAIA